jgi:predicted membrane protein
MHTYTAMRVLACSAIFKNCFFMHFITFCWSNEISFYLTYVYQFPQFHKIPKKKNKKQKKKKEKKEIVRVKKLVPKKDCC